MGDFQTIAAGKGGLSNDFHGVRQCNRRDIIVAAEGAFSNAGNTEEDSFISHFSRDDKIAGKLWITAPAGTRVPGQLHRIGACDLVPKISRLEAVIEVRRLAVVILKFLVGDAGSYCNAAAGCEAGGGCGAHCHRAVPKAGHLARFVHNRDGFICAGPSQGDALELVRVDGISNLRRCPHI